MRCGIRRTLYHEAAISCRRRLFQLLEHFVTRLEPVKERLDVRQNRVVPHALGNLADHVVGDARFFVDEAPHPLMLIQAPTKEIDDRFVQLKHSTILMRTRIGVKAPMHEHCAHNAYVTKNKTLRHTLGENAKAIRAAKKLSQPKVVAAAKKSGGQIDQTTVSRIERCLQPATVDSIEALAKGLGVHPWELLIPGNADEKFLAIVKAWSQASPAGRELLVIAADGAMRRDGKELERELSQDASAKRGGTGSH